MEKEDLYKEEFPTESIKGHPLETADLYKEKDFEYLEYSGKSLLCICETVSKFCNKVKVYNLKKIISLYVESLDTINVKKSDQSAFFRNVYVHLLCL